MDDSMLDDSMLDAELDGVINLQSSNRKNPDVKPVTTFKIGDISAAVWRNVSSHGYVFFNITVRRAYKDPDGNWQNTNSFTAKEALVAAECLRQAALWAAQEHGQGFRT